MTQDISIDATLRLAQHVSATRYSDLPASAIHAFKRAFQDHVTCAIAGSAMPVSRAVLEYFRETDASRIANVIGTEALLSPQGAALVNGANTHGLDFDDGHTNGSAHPSGAIFPAILAAAQQYNATPREIVLVRVNSGRSFEKRVLDPKGEGENPMSDDDLKRKFVVNCTPVIGKDRCEQLMQLVWNFENAKTVAELFN